jgi:hypothetical protein
VLGGVEHGGKVREDLFATDQFLVLCGAANPLRVGRTGVRSHGRNEPEAAPVNGLDDALAITIVPECSPHLADSPGQRGVRNGDVTPYVVEEFLTRDDPVSVPHEVQENVENLRLNENGFAAASELARVLVELTVLEDELHGISRSSVGTGR